MIAEYAYIAGVLDSEGCIGIYKNKGSKDNRYKRGTKPPSWIRSITIASTNHSLLDDILQTAGLGMIRFHKSPKGTKAQYTWAIGAKADILVFLEPLLPYLREKQGQASVLMEECRGNINTTEAAAFLKRAKR